MGEVVIRAENVSKQYRLGMVGTGTIRSDLGRWWAKMRGKEDPFLKIGERNDRTAKGAGDLVWALKDINFEVKRGEVLGIIGKNGAGKSTLLKILARTTTPTTGRIGVKGRIASLLEVGTGFHPELSGRENIFLNGAILGMTKQEIRRKFDEIVDFSGVERYIDTPVKRYSSGMYVRLAFAVAAHLEPEILIIDEVLAVGDFEFQKRCLGKMKDISEGGRTVLFVSHNLTAVRNLCTRGIFLNQGELSFDGEIDQAIERYLGGSDGNVKRTININREENKEAQLRRVSILDEHDSDNGILEISKQITVEIEYELHASISGLSVGISIAQAGHGENLLAFNDAEMDAQRLEARKPGTYVCRVVLPSLLLNSGKFRLRVGITSQRIVYSVIDDLIFELVDQTGIFQHLGYPRKNAMLSLQLPWNTMQLTNNRHE